MKTHQEISQRAQAIWDKQSSAGRSYIGMGLMPDDDIQREVEQGFERDDITTALLSLYEKNHRLHVITAGKGKPKRRGPKWRKK